MQRRSTSLSRRDVLRLSGLGLLGSSSSGWLPGLARALAGDPRRRRHCVLLWMSGGPSQTDTFDMKPDHANGGEFKEVATRVPGLRFSEHLPQLGERADQLAIVRSLKTKEGDHARGTHLVRTGQPPGTDVDYPSIACSLAKELALWEGTGLPDYVSITPQLQFAPAAFGPGFLGPRFAPATVGGTTGPTDANGFANLRLENLELPPGVGQEQAARRLQLWKTLEADFLARRGSPAAVAHNTLYHEALAMMSGRARAAFDLSSEADEVRQAYGRGRFGQGCLLARRLIERGVPFVEVALGDGLGWDTHADNFNQVRQLSAELDAGWGTLIRELDDRGLLESTTIVWMGEFGRTPMINNNAGRDHFPAAWTCAFAGGGIAGGQAYGRTSRSGTSIEENETQIGDVLATLCAALGVDPAHENLVQATGRPIKLTEGTPIREILA